MSADDSQVPVPQKPAVPPDIGANFAPKRKPWLLIGGAATLLLCAIVYVGFAALLGMGARENLGQLLKSLPGGAAVVGGTEWQAGVFRSQLQLQEPGGSLAVALQVHHYPTWDRGALRLHHIQVLPTMAGKKFPGSIDAKVFLGGALTGQIRLKPKGSDLPPGWQLAKGASLSFKYDGGDLVSLKALIPQLKGAIPGVGDLKAQKFSAVWQGKIAPAATKQKFRIQLAALDFKPQTPAIKPLALRKSSLGLDLLVNGPRVGAMAMAAFSDSAAASLPLAKASQDLRGTLKLDLPFKPQGKLAIQGKLAGKSHKFKLSAPRALVNDFVPPKGLAQLAAAAKAGMVTFGEDQVSAFIEIKDGQLYIGGKPIPNANF